MTKSPWIYQQRWQQTPWISSPNVGLLKKSRLTEHIRLGGTVILDASQFRCSWGLHMLSRNNGAKFVSPKMMRAGDEKLIINE